MYKILYNRYDPFIGPVARFLKNLGEVLDVTVVSFLKKRPPLLLRIMDLAWCSGRVMDCHATTWGSITGGDGVKTKRHVHRKGQ